MRNLGLLKQTAGLGLVACIAVTAVGLARAETAVIAWERRIGVTEYWEDGYYTPVTFIATDAAGNSIYFGQGRTSTGTALWVNKVDALGTEVLWRHDLGGEGTTLAADAITDKAGNVFVAGSTTESLSGPNKGGADGFVAQLSATSGEPVWLRQIGTPAQDRVTKIARDTRNNVFVAMGGSLVKLSPAGNVIWQKTAAATHLRIDAGGNLIVAGKDASGKYWVTKWLANGPLAWKKSLAGAPTTLALDPLGRVIVGFGGRIAKYSEAGVLLWKRTQATYSDISADANGDLYVMTDEAILAKLSGAAGLVYWTKNVDPGSSTAIRYLRTGDNGNSVVIGAAPDETSGTDFYWAAKYDRAGNMIWYQRADSPDAWCEQIHLVNGVLHRSGDVFVALNTEVIVGTRLVPWGIRFDAIP